MITDTEAINELIKLLWDEESPECDHPKCGHNYICHSCKTNIAAIEIIRKARGREPVLK